LSSSVMPIGMPTVRAQSFSHLRCPLTYHQPVARPKPNTLTQAKYDVRSIIHAAPLRQLAYICVTLPTKNPGYM
jgi:hypothetical protein